MANIKSAKKRIKVINKKTLRNKMIKSQVKTAMKKVIVAVNAGDKEAAAVALKGAASAIDRAYIKGKRIPHQAVSFFHAITKGDH